MLEETVRQKLIVLIDNGSTTNTGILMSIRPPVPEECRKKHCKCLSVLKLVKHHSFSLRKDANPQSLPDQKQNNHTKVQNIMI